MVFFSRSIMNGATFLGVGATLLALAFAFNITGNSAPILFYIGIFYLVCSVLAFFFPKLSEK